MRYLSLVVLLLVSFVSFGQAPSNYTNINGRYRWIAGMFDSTFHIPKGTTPSLRTGGSTNAGGLFYNTADSSVYTYTGTQWIKARGSINPQDTTNKYVTQVYKKSGSDSVFYVKGGVHTWAFNDSTGSPGGGGGGKIYYFNGGVSMGTFGGFTMYELGDTANTGTAANFTRATTGNIANFITDPGKPGLLQIPAGVWSIDAYLSETGSGSNNAEIYVQVEKWDGSTITTIATSPIEQITNGTVIDLYTWSVSIPTTALAVTDRIIIQFYIQNTNGKTVTLYTQNGYVGQVHTTFTTGIGAINGLTAPAQYLVTGTSGTDFNINSATATHTFNLPTASSTNRGALSTTDWSTFNNKIGGTLVSGYLTKATGTNTIDTSQIYQSNGRIGVSTVTPQTRLMVAETASDGALSILGNPSNVATFKFYANNGSTIQSVVNSSSSAMQIGTFVNSEMNLITNSATRVSILNNGNVGIGSGAGTDSMLTVENGARFKRGVRMSGLPSGVGIKSLRVDANGTVSLADTLANGISGTGTTNYIPKFTSSSAIGNSLLFDNGTNVLINNTTVLDNAVRLQVTSSSSGVTSFSSLADDVIFEHNTNLGLTFATPNTAIATIAFADPESNLAGAIQYSHVDNYLAFATAAAERMRLDASGNLGIGTSSPAYRLDVLESGATTAANSFSMARITGSDAVANDLTLIGPNTSQVRIKFGDPDDATIGEVGYNHSTNAMRFNTNGAQRMTLDASGNLGLGVTPSAWISTYKALQIGNASIMSRASGNDSYWSGNAYFDGAWKYIYSSFAQRYEMGEGKHSWFTAPSGTAGNAITFTQAMTLDASGRLGIGTTSPSQKLEVNGISLLENIQIGTTSAFLSNSVNAMIGWASSFSGYTNGTLILQSRSSASTPIVFATGSTSAVEQMRITSGGELLVNTTSDAGDYKLQVNGNAIIVGSISTGAPTGGTARPFKIGQAAVVTPTSPNRTIEIEIDGVTYYLSAKTTNN
jgi:hypothetical protein